MHANTKITFLYLGHNQFTNLSDIVLDQNITTEILRLNDNNITSLSGVHNYLRNVKELQLNGNPIQEIDSDFFNQFKYLRSLNLTQTDIKMQPKMFGEGLNFRELSLRHNSLTELDVTWFEGVSELTELDVEDNFIEDFDYEGFVVEFPSLKRLKLSGNKFNCSYVQEMVERFDEIGKLDLLEDPYQELSKELKDGKVFGVTCDTAMQEEELEVKDGARRNLGLTFGVITSMIFIHWTI